MGKSDLPMIRLETDYMSLQLEHRPESSLAPCLFDLYTNFK